MDNTFRDDEHHTIIRLALEHTAIIRAIIYFFDYPLYHQEIAYLVALAYVTDELPAFPYIRPMDGDISTLFRIVYPQIPTFFKSVGSWTLGWSETSSKWDLKQEVVINFLRQLLDNPNPRPISKTQKFSLADPGVKGRMWVADVDIPKPAEDNFRQIVFSCIDAMKQSNKETYYPAESCRISAEWTGYRANVAEGYRREAPHNPAETYKNILAGTTNQGVVLYQHGGAHFMMSAASHRLVVSRLCKKFGGRALSINYRLCPQNPFPSALMDALMAYIYLLYPPEGALHEPVPAEMIVLAGDSAGGHQSFSLLQLLLQINRMSAAGSLPKTIKVYGQDVSLPLPLPAGVAGSSPWLDITRCLPSLEKNAKYDYLPPPSKMDHKTYPPDEIWPANPPREDLFCNGNILCHPLVSPLAAKDWTGSPPIFFGLGEEMLADENAVIARRLIQQGIKVRWEQFEAQCHCFGMIFEGNPAAKMFMDGWSKAIKDMIESPSALQTQGTFIYAKTLVRENVDPARVIEMSDEEVYRTMNDARDKKIAGLRGEAEVLPML